MKGNTKKLGRLELDKLFCLLCDLLEDATPEERRIYRDSIDNVKALRWCQTHSKGSVTVIKISF